MEPRPTSRWAETDEAALFVRARNAVVAALDAQFRGGYSPEYERSFEDQFAITHGLVRFRDASIRDVFGQVSSREQLAEAIENLVTAAAAVPDNYGQIRSTLDTVIAAIEQAFRLHPSLNFRLATIQGHYEVLPAVAAELDREVVDTTITWLATYPAIQAEARNSLHFLAHSEFPRALDAARQAVEMLMRATLGNAKSLENQIGDGAVAKPFLAWLREHGAKAETVNLSRHVIDSFCDLQNAWVKHQPPTGADFERAEAEFGVYLAFTVMRFITQSAR
jgi:hypothetical protein